jgi:hypothetical protein
MKNSSVQEKIINLFDIAQTLGTKHTKQIIGCVTKRQLNDITSAGVHISEKFKHTIDVYAIIHSLKKHGSQQTEELRGQIAITKRDFEKVPDVLENYDYIAINKNKRNQDVIIYQKAYSDGTTLYAEEVRTGREELAMGTLYKMKKALQK